MIAFLVLMCSLAQISSYRIAVGSRSRTNSKLMTASSEVRGGILSFYVDYGIPFKS